MRCRRYYNVTAVLVRLTIDFVEVNFEASVC
jgi:hypothetical protein